MKTNYKLLINLFNTWYDHSVIVKRQDGTDDFYTKDIEGNEIGKYNSLYFTILSDLLHCHMDYSITNSKGIITTVKQVFKYNGHPLSICDKLETINNK